MKTTTRGMDRMRYDGLEIQQRWPVANVYCLCYFLLVFALYSHACIGSFIFPSSSAFMFLLNLHFFLPSLRPLIISSCLTLINSPLKKSV